MPAIEPLAVSSLGLDPDALANLDASIQSDIDGGRIYGASVIVARGGKVGHRKTFGTSDTNRPTSESDLYLMMSLSKSFTAALMLRAIDQGRFTLDTKVCDVIPEFGAMGKQNVTLRQIMSHTGGVWQQLPPPPPATPAQLGDLATYVKLVSAQPLAYKAGTRAHYAPSAGHALLAQMLVVTDPLKRSFRDIARQDLFDPLGMTQMTYGLGKSDPRRVPVRHTPSQRSASTDASEALLGVLDETSEWPGGGAFGTTEDVFRFAEMMRGRGSANGYRVLSPALFDYASQNHTGDMQNHAFDFFVEKFNMTPLKANFSLMGGYVRGHGHHLSPSGATASPRSISAVGGGSTLWMVDPERDLTFVFLSSGFLEGLFHLERLSRLSDLALASCE